MNWQQIAADALAHEPNVPDSAVRELADDLALTAQAFVLDRLAECRQEAIEAIREARWNARIDEVRRT